MVSSSAAVTNLGSNFLERLGNQSKDGFNRLQRTNPGRRRRLGGHGSAALPDLVRRLRQLYEKRRGRGFRRRYQKDLGRRRPQIGARVVPGINIGLSIDQSRSAIDIPLALQSATIDLTPDRFHGLRRQRAVDLGQRGGARFRQHQFAPRHRLWASDRRIQCAARRRAERDQLLLEQGPDRIVPKAAFEYVRAGTGSLQEIGGLDPVSATGATIERWRDLGRRGGRPLLDLQPKIFDLSGYGKFVDNVVQNFSDHRQPWRAEHHVAGDRREPVRRRCRRVGVAQPDRHRRLYANYDGKLRAVMQSHQGTLGVEVKW